MSDKNKEKRTRHMTEAALAANRENSQHSTGANTEEGKAAVRFNAVKSGARGAYVLLPNEPEDEYLAHCNSIIEGYMPQSWPEWKLAVRIAQNDWRIDRIVNLESQAIQMTSNRRELEAELLKLSLYETRLDRNSAKCQKRMDDLCGRREKLTGQYGDKTFVLPVLTCHDLFDGPCVGIQMPLDKVDGEEWREHLEDVAMACMPADQLPPVERDPNRPTWSTKGKDLKPMREADIDNPASAHWFTPEEHAAHQAKKAASQGQTNSAGQAPSSPAEQPTQDAASPLEGEEERLAKKSEPYSSGEGELRQQADPPHGGRGQVDQEKSPVHASESPEPEGGDPLQMPAQGLGLASFDKNGDRGGKTLPEPRSSQFQYNAEGRPIHPDGTPLAPWDVVPRDLEAIFAHDEEDSP